MTIHKNKNIYSKLASIEGEILFKSLGKVDELQKISESAVAIAMMRKGNGGIGRRTMRSKLNLGDTLRLINNISNESIDCSP